MKSKRNFAANQYLQLSQDHLVTLSLWYLLEDRREPSFENLVAEAFSTFPERFQLEGYPEWPNANVIAKSWVRCRTDKKWISGATSAGFALTPMGEQVANRTLTELDQINTGQSPRKSGSRQTIGKPKPQASHRQSEIRQDELMVGYCIVLFSLNVQLVAR